MDIDANERSITHKLAEYLQDEFPVWNVDCEYNRRGDKVKRLVTNFASIDPMDTEAKTVFPDITVHRRQTDQNLIALEVKKAGGRENTNDIKKLCAFTEPQDYHYEYGLFLELDPGGNSTLELFREGKLEESWTGDLQEALGEMGYGE